MTDPIIITDLGRAEDRADAHARIGRTAIQAGGPGAVIVVANWAATLAGLDLDPGAGRDLPANVVAAVGVLLTIAAAWAMNRPARQ